MQQRFLALYSITQHYNIVAIKANWGANLVSRVLSYTGVEQERTLGTRLSGEHRTSEKRAKGVMGTSFH